MGRLFDKLFCGMGEYGLPLPPLPELPSPAHAAAQHALWQHQSAIGGPARFGASPDRVVLSVGAQSTKAAAKIAAALEQLPMRLAAHIVSIQFIERGSDQVFVVNYDNRRSLEFADIDAFPSEADIARIALECP